MYRLLMLAFVVGSVSGQTENIPTSHDICVNQELHVYSKATNSWSCDESGCTTVLGIGDIHPTTTNTLNNNTSTTLTNVWILYENNNAWAHKDTNWTNILYCIDMPDDYTPTASDPGFPPDCEEWSREYNNSVTRLSDCYAYDQFNELATDDYFYFIFAGIAIIVFVYLVARGACNAQLYDSAHSTVYAEILDQHGMYRQVYNINFDYSFC